MVLVDTSVWVRFFANRAPFGEELDRLLADRQVAGHELIFGELLIGDTGGRKDFLLDYRLMRWIPSIAHDETVAFVRMHKLQGKGIGWIDAHLLASAIVADTPLWTADARLARLASGLGVAHGLR
jgi:hypothetical protein